MEKGSIMCGAVQRRARLTPDATCRGDQGCCSGDFSRCSCSLYCATPQRRCPPRCPCGCDGRCNRVQAPARLSLGPGSRVLAAEDVPAGEFVAELLGKFVLARDARVAAGDPEATAYVFRHPVADDVVVDCRAYSSCVARNVRRSPDGNARFLPLFEGFLFRVGLFAARDISKGEAIEALPREAATAERTPTPASPVAAAGGGTGPVPSLVVRDTATPPAAAAAAAAPETLETPPSALRVRIKRENEAHHAAPERARSKPRLDDELRTEECRAALAWYTAMQAVSQTGEHEMELGQAQMASADNAWTAAPDEALAGLRALRAQAEHGVASAGIGPLFERLHVCTGLRVLSLRNFNHLNDAAVRALSGLRALVSLRLEVPHWKLIDALPTSLTDLDLTSSTVGDSGAQAIATRLKCLQSLRIALCGVTPKGILVVGKGLGHCLQTLSVDLESGARPDMLAEMIATHFAVLRCLEVHLYQQPLLVALCTQCMQGRLRLLRRLELYNVPSLEERRLNIETDVLGYCSSPESP
eukprot:m51a1_g11728 hypothetical protein (529) ;mRNA; r:112318-114181